MDEQTQGGESETYVAWGLTEEDKDHRKAPAPSCWPPVCLRYSRNRIKAKATQFMVCVLLHHFKI